MADRFTQVSHRSLFGNIGNSIVGVFIGAILGLISVPLLFWNEHNAVQTANGLAEARKNVIQADAAAVKPENDGKLIYLTGKAETDEKLNDEELNISVPALLLKRSILVYQWREEKSTTNEKEFGGGTKTTTTYTYSKGWDSTLANSSNFNQSGDHQNPTSIPVKADSFMVKESHLGSFTLTDSILGKLSADEALPVKDEDLERLPEKLHGKVKLVEQGFYIGKDPANPAVGDEKVTYKVLRPTEISLVAQQTGNTLAPFQTKSGGTVELAQIGVKPASALVSDAEAANTMATWLFRAVGFVMIWIAYGLLMRPISVLANIIPFLGGIVEFGAGFFSFIAAAVSSLVIVAIAWFFVRPLLSIGLIAAGIGIYFLAHRSRPSAKAQA